MTGYGGIGSGGTRIAPFDSVFIPIAFGNAGHAGRSDSSCSSGNGGGFLNLTVSGTLQIDGQITSRY